MSQTKAVKVSLQSLSDAGINPFAVQLVHESISRKPDYDKWTGPLSFEFDGIVFTLEKAKAENEDKQ